jgi:hypothetical protein
MLSPVRGLRITRAERVAGAKAAKPVNFTSSPAATDSMITSCKAETNLSVAAFDEPVLSATSLIKADLFSMEKSPVSHYALKPLATTFPYRISEN